MQQIQKHQPQMHTCRRRHSRPPNGTQRGVEGAGQHVGADVDMDVALGAEDAAEAGLDSNPSRQQTIKVEEAFPHHRNHQEANSGEGTLPSSSIITKDQ